MFNNQVIAGSSGQGGGFYDFPLEQSLRFNDDDNAYLSRTPASAGNRKTWTFSCWVKRGKVSDTDAQILTAYTSASDTTNIIFQSGGAIQWYDYISGYRVHLVTNALYRDVGSWYHLLFQLDTSNATSGDRAKIYVNGERVTSFSTEVYPSLNADLKMNTAIEHRIGDTAQFAREFDGYMAEVNFIDGQALDPTSFGEFKSGIWIPKDPTGLTYGTNGFRLNFADTVEASGFNALTWTGTGQSQALSGLGFSPDLIWQKSRNFSDNHFLVDSVRGVNQGLSSNLTAAEVTSGASNDMVSFDADGFTTGVPQNYSSAGSNGYNIVSWCWDAGSGSPVSNTDGSITSTVKANTDYGFSIATYTGTGANATIGHGLGQTPDAVIVKQRSAAGNHWVVWTNALSGTQFLYLDSTGTTNTNANIWNSTTPTSSVFSVGSDAQTNGSGNNLVAYCFAEKTGYSKFGSYNGTGSSGLSVTGLGFKPAFLMVKSSTAAESWQILDNTREVAPDEKQDLLYANLSNAEATMSGNVEFTDDGFNVNTTIGNFNLSGQTYLFMAFADTRDAAFWRDVSGQGNDWQPNNLTFSDVVPDAPSNNFATNRKGLNQTASEGNLRFERTANVNNHTGNFPNMCAKSGKWYAELRMIDSGIDTAAFAVVEGRSFSPTTDTTAYQYTVDGNTVADGKGYYSWLINARKDDGYAQTETAYGTALTANVAAIIMCALDLDNGKVWWGKDGTWFNSGDPAAGTNAAFTSSNLTDSKDGFGFASSLYTGRGGAYHIFNYGQDSTFAGARAAGGNADENGYGDFAYAPPSGYLSLCSANLPSGAIDTLNDETPEDYFNTVLWTGDDANPRSLTGIGFQPDFVWTKQRSSNGGGFTSHQLYDNVRGTQKLLRSNTTDAELANPSNGGIQSFDADGFTIQGSSASVNMNDNTETYVGWNWKAGGTGVSNTDGSITSTVSVGATSQQNWFSVVKYTGTGGNDSYGHGLNIAPNMIITKDMTDPANWAVYVSNIGTGKYLQLNSTAGTVTNSVIYPSVSSTTIGVGVQGDGSITNTSGDNYISYCFANAENLCKVGNYVGNGSTDGTFIHTGFRPAFVMVKRTDSANMWLMMDDKRYTYNVMGVGLRADTSEAEFGWNPSKDFLSNGFKVRTSNGAENASGGSYIYLALASQPFKYANAR